MATKLQRRNDEVWGKIVELSKSVGYEKDRYGNLVKGEKYSRTRYKRKAVNVRKEREIKVEDYDGKFKSEWVRVWSYPLSSLDVVDGKITRIKKANK